MGMLANVMCVVLAVFVSSFFVSDKSQRGIVRLRDKLQEIACSSPVAEVVQSAKANATELETLIERLRSDNGQLQAKLLADNADLQKKLYEKEVVVADLTHRLEQAATHIASKETEISDLKSKNGELRLSLNEKTGQVAELTSKVLDLQSKLDGKEEAKRQAEEAARLAQEAARQAEEARQKALEAWRAEDAKVPVQAGVMEWVVTGWSSVLARLHAGQVVEGPVMYSHSGGYKVGMALKLQPGGSETLIYSGLVIHQGRWDDQVSWPFSRTWKVEYWNHRGFWAFLRNISPTNPVCFSKPTSDKNPPFYDNSAWSLPGINKYNLQGDSVRIRFTFL